MLKEFPSLRRLCTLGNCKFLTQEPYDRLEVKVESLVNLNIVILDEGLKFVSFYHPILHLIKIGHGCSNHRQVSISHLMVVYLNN